jgi:chromosome segregation ATPase
MAGEEYLNELKEAEGRIKRLIQRRQDLEKPFEKLSAHLESDPRLLDALRTTLAELEHELDQRDELIQRARST